VSDPDLYQSRWFHEWHEDHGDVIWWVLGRGEPPWVGTPNDLGRTLAVEVHIDGKEAGTIRHDVGGWPFEEADKPDLVWTPLPGAIRWPSGHSHE
jgi:hypothetical protein